MSENSKSQAELIEGFRQCMRDFFKLIVQDENFSELKTEIQDCKEAKLTKMVMELSHVRADQNEHLTKEVSKNTRQSTTPIKTQQVTQTSNKSKFPTHVDVEVNFNPSGGGFHIIRREDSESSISKSSDSKSEPLMSTKKIINPAVKTYASAVKETKGHDREELLKKISNLEEEKLNLNKKNQDLKDENALLEDQKANVAELNRKIETTEKVIEEFKEKIKSTDDEIAKLKQDLSRKDVDSQIMSENVAVVKLEGSGKLGFRQCVEEILYMTELDETISEMTVEFYHSENPNLTTVLNELKKSTADQNVDLDKHVSKTPGGGFNNSSVKKHEWKVKETKAQDNKKISNLENEKSSLKKKIQDLEDDNALLEAEKSNVEKLLEASREQVLAANDEKKKLKTKMCTQAFDKVFDAIEKQSTIEKRDEEIKELNTQIDQLKISHAAEVDRLNTRMEKFKSELREKIGVLEDLKNLIMSEDAV